MTFPEGKLGQAYFVIKATVVSEQSPGTELACLAAKVVPSKKAEVKTAAVEGALVDEAGKFADYAAYNYRVTVTGAPANITLTWGENAEIDPFFKINHGATVNVEKRTATFTMEPGSMVVNFYRADGKTPDGWGDLGISVSGTTLTDTAETQ